MVALGFKIKHTVYHRIPTCGGMDSEPGGTTVEEDIITVVVPKDDEYWRISAENYITRYNGHSHDDAFEIIGEPTVTRINAIMQDVTTRLD